MIPHRDTPDHLCTCASDYRCPPCREGDKRDREAEDREVTAHTSTRRHCNS